MELPAGKGQIGVGTGQMGEGADQIQSGMVGDPRDKFLKFRQAGTQPVHPGVELDLNESRLSDPCCRTGEFAGFLHRGEGEGQTVLQSDGKF